MAKQKTYWKGFEDLENNSKINALKNKEFLEHLPIDLESKGNTATKKDGTSRRDFLKLMGFSTAAATLAACEGPVKKSIPYVVQPDQVIPGIANYYASTYYDGHDFASVLVRTREGRPIKIERNKMSKSFGHTNARIQGSLLEFYDNTVLRGPKQKGSPTNWEEIDISIRKKLESTSASGKKIVILTSTLLSPTTKKLIGEFKAKYPSSELVEYNALANVGAVKAYQRFFGLKKALPTYDFTKADTIVSFEADFLGDWYGGNVEADYAKRRNPDQKLSRHIQLEGNMSLTGANADHRIPAKPSKQTKILVAIYESLNGKPTKDPTVSKIIKEIQKAGSKALIISGSYNANVQMIAFAINQKIRSEAFLPYKPSFVRATSNEGINDLLSDLDKGKVGILMSHLVNPIYTLPNSEKVKKQLQSVIHISFSRKEDETGHGADFNAPSHHAMESWGDAEPKPGEYLLAQPVIRPLFNTRQFEDSLLQWINEEHSPISYYEYLKNNWKSSILGGKSWNLALHNGVFEKESDLQINPISIDLSTIIDKLKKNSASNIELILYSKIGMGNGQQANNPWLQEFPDPISRATWDNYLTISKEHADELSLKNFIDEDIMQTNGAINGSLANITVGGVEIKNVPVLIQPGQAYGSVGLAFGYGRTKAGKTSLTKNNKPIGVNAFALYKNFQNTQADVKIEKVKGEHRFAFLQLHSTMMGRDIVKETTRDIYKRGKGDVHEFNHPHFMETINGKEHISKIDLWRTHDHSIGPHFNLSIDLNACTGCGACVIACQVENNVPVVGKEEVRRYRDMHWLRIDRYYSSEESFYEDKEKKEINAEGLSKKKLNKQLESPSENPEVVFQPVMCQHCNHAPCETVCPVAATSHGKQGQNQMAYNRCVGTRYCANNCPYKVRRFNWFLYAENEKFDYHMNNDLGRMVLNPDVVVRSRGVMEKCSMCIQMTQASILKAKKERRPLKDEDLQTACTVACETGAMVFGDINNEESKITQLFDSKKNKRKYYLLEEVGTKPNVFYNLKVRNKLKV